MTHFYQRLSSFAQQLSTSMVWRNLLLLVMWLAVWMLGLLVEYTEHASVWFPAAGLTFAALFIVGVRAIPSLLSACVGITFWAGYYYQLELGFAHIIPYYVGARILRYLAHRGQFNLPLFVIGFLLIAALSSMLATIAVIAALVLSAMLPFSAVSSTWLPFWIGDLAGVVVISGA